MIYPNNSKPVSISGSSSFVPATIGEISNNRSSGWTKALRRLEDGVGGDCFSMPPKFGADCILLAKGGFSGEGVGSSGISVRLAAEDDRHNALIESSLGEAVEVGPAVS